MREKLLAALPLAVGCAMAGQAAAQTPGPTRVDMVSLTGCVTPGPGDTWLLTSATDPVVTTPKESPTPATPPALGKNRFTLIGILEMNVPSHKDHTVTVKGLLVPGHAKDDRRINVTSVRHVAPTCR